MEKFEAKKLGEIAQNLQRSLKRLEMAGFVDTPAHEYGRMRHQINRIENFIQLGVASNDR